MYIKTREVHNGDTDTGEDDVLFHIPMDNTLCVHMFISVYIAICLFPVTCFSNNIYNSYRNVSIQHLPIPCHMFFKQYIHNSSRNMSHSGHITYTIMCTFKTIHCRYNQNSYTSRIKVQSKLAIENTQIKTSINISQIQSFKTKFKILGS